MIRVVMVDSGEVLLRMMSWETRLKRALGAWAGVGEGRLALAAQAARASAAAAPSVDLLPTWEAEDEYALSLAEVVAEALSLPGLDARYVRDTCHYLNACQPYADAVEALATLRDMGFGIGVISDAPPSMRAALARNGLLDLVDHVTLSSDVGHMKPDPEVFAAALAAAGVAAAEAVFVDDMPANVDGARAVGFAQAYVIDRDGHATGRRDRLGRLTALPALLAGHAPVARDVPRDRGVASTARAGE